MVLITQTPKFVYDDSGRLVEVIFSAETYISYLRDIAAQEDWETLPPVLQDAIDRLLIEEVRMADEGLVDLDELLAETDS